MKLFILSLSATEMQKEPWGHTVEMIVRAESEQRAREEFLKGEYKPNCWDCEELTVDGKETMITSSEYGN